VTISPALQVRNLVKRFGATTAVDGLDLDARAGAVTVVLGRNGAGKTTTFECCVGLVAPSGGTIELWGLPPGHRDVRPRLGVMLQDGGLPRGVSVERALRYIGSLFPAPLDARALLDEVGLERVAASRVESLSGGEARRLSLACALVGRPELLFLDEPSAGLDPHARLALWETVGRLRNDGAAVVLATHDLAEAEALADTVVIVDSGRVVAAGSVASLLADFGTETLEAAFFAATTRSDPA